MIRRILDKYEKAQALDGKYIQAEKRINYLHKKLNHIKKCCIEFMEANPHADVINLIKSHPATRQHV